FKFIGEVFTNPQGEPVLVTIDPGDYSSGNWRGVNRLIVQRMMEINPDTTYWQRFDRRTNRPNYTVDNSTNPQSDGKIDYIVFIYRYNYDADPGHPWHNNQPIPGMQNWDGSSGGVFYSTGVITSPNNPINGFRFPDGVTLCRGAGKPTELFIHEFAHSVY